ncbi:MAG TPA: selenocysteine-specific translation elongation factor [Ktedonobacteraceae bacterium]|nr:selenocysteine-specific translation elongation factor [Ktedonobacteraceae bacterium]
MSCIGTAGHVDHGKSTLVKALTGIDPDRLAEEKERGMTIDLGFAWLKLPSGREVSIVDVPGHESFIKNMLAGVGGIDAALLVVAADEGVMPQTREHLAILDLLGVSSGVVALTKADLVDEEWLELVHEEVEEQLKGTTLANAAIQAVSVYTGRGLPELLSALEKVLREAQDRQNIARPRLPVDRVFTLTGFGTVVTGTLLDGSFKSGQEVEILPQGTRTRIRGIQTHKHQVENVGPGSRAALNLANVARNELERGNVVCQPGQMRSTVLCDVRLHILADAAHPLAHNTQVDFYSGAQEISARVRLLDVDELRPGESGWAQLRLSRAAVVAKRDRFIIRIPSPSMTIGGGEIIDVQARHHRRHQPQVLDGLERLEQGSPEEQVLAALDRRIAGRGTGKSVAGGTFQGRTGYELPEIIRQCNLAEDVTLKVLETLLSEERVRKIGEYWFAQRVWEELAEEAVHLVREQHRHYPLRSGLSKEEWRARLHLAPRMANEVFSVLATEEKLEAVPEGTIQQATGASASSRPGVALPGGLIRVFNFTPRFSEEQQRQIAQIVKRFQENPYTPPERSEVERSIGGEVVSALIEQGRFIKVGTNLLFLREAYEEARERLIVYLQEHGKITVAEARDVLGGSRKYILPLLEQMDALHITRRVGDERVLGQAVLRS